MARPYSRPYSRRLPLPPPYIELHRRPLLGSKVNREGNSVAHGGEPSTRPRGCAASAVPGLPLTHEEMVATEKGGRAEGRAFLPLALAKIQPESSYS